MFKLLWLWDFPIKQLRLLYRNVYNSLMIFCNIYKDKNVERAVDFLFSHDNIESLANEEAKPEE